MELIDRYLHAIRRALPPAKADDITAEIADDIASRIEAREAKLGRALSADETSALLKEVGHPLVVASRYRPHQWLIGPEVYPLYVATMRIVLLIVSAVVIAVAAAHALFGGQDVGGALVEAISSLWVSATVNIAIITLVFAVLERRGFPGKGLPTWVPDQLPDVADKQPGTWESAFEVAFGAAFLLWWSGVIHIPYPTGGADFRLELAPGFEPFYWPIFALAAVRLVHNLIQWLRPRWKTLRRAIGAVTLVGGLAILALLYRAGRWVTVASASMPADKVAELDKALNLSLSIAIVVVGVIWTFAAVREIWRIGRARFDRG